MNTIKDVCGQSVVSQLVYDRTKEKLDFWKDQAKHLTKHNEILIAKVAKLERAICVCYAASQSRWRSTS